MKIIGYIMCENSSTIDNKLAGIQVSSKVKNLVGIQLYSKVSFLVK